jgi:CHAT domain-containing protein
LRAIQVHLRELYAEVVAPVRPFLKGQHLIIVPHDVLHYLPFHALFDGEHYLIDAFTISYAPSASIYFLCHHKPANAVGGSLILGVPDPQTPFILEEVQSVASILPRSELFLGADANETTLLKRGPQSRFVHIATHGYFRHDNPMFSGIRLADSHLNLYDLYSLQLPAELVTLSGCATGLSAIAPGDELLGLVRVLLYAGAQSLLLSLWDVSDRSTAEFMKSFYRSFMAHGNKAVALQNAMKELREDYAHPYYWAPFVMIGRAFAQ